MSQAPHTTARPVLTHTLGFPRMGARRALKFALESHWRGDSTAADLQATAAELRQQHWQIQADAGLGFVTVGDFALYDHVANHIQLMGCEPARFAFGEATPALERYFAMARGVSAKAVHAHTDCGHGCSAPLHSTGQPALEMTKWFDTNYHYLVPEFHAATRFSVASECLFDEVHEAQALGHKVKAVLLGPLSFLWLGKSKEAGFDRFTLLDQLLPVYESVLARLKAQGVEWVQIDEPILGLDLPDPWRHAFEPAYWQLARSAPKLLLATYFSPLQDNLRLACQLPVAGLHVDAVRAPQELVGVVDWLPAHKVLSVGLVDGRNIWRTDLDAALARLRPVADKHQARCGWHRRARCCMYRSACRPRSSSTRNCAPGWPLPWKSLMSWRCWPPPSAREKHAAGGRAARGPRCPGGPPRQPPRAPRHCGGPAGRSRTRRRPAQQPFPAAPTGPARTAQAAAAAHHHHWLVSADPEIRTARAAFKRGALDAAHYQHSMRAEIQLAVRQQEALGIDVLVHGEAERNDMVEYFGEQLDGFAFTQHGWVQSYGSRCVKPPIIYGDVARPAPMTVAWTQFAQSLTDKPMKGMLTGPVTMLQWCFVRDDQPRSQTAEQIAWAIRDEVCDLEAAGIAIIQIDEARPPRGPAAAQGRLEAVPGLGHTGFSHQRQRRAGRHADPHAHVLQRVQRHPARNRRHGRRRDHHRNNPLGHGAAAGFWRLQIPQRNRPRRVRHPLAARARCERDDGSAAKSRPGCAHRPPVGQPRLRPQNPWLARDRSRSGQHGAGGTHSAGAVGRRNIFLVKIASSAYAQSACSYHI